MSDKYQGMYRCVHTEDWQTSGTCFSTEHPDVVILDAVPVQMKLDLVTYNVPAEVADPNLLGV